MKVYIENPGIHVCRDNPETPVLAELKNMVILSCTTHKRKY